LRTVADLADPRQVALDRPAQHQSRRSSRNRLILMHGTSSLCFSTRLAWFSRMRIAVLLRIGSDDAA
jgi:hypothetical protein